MTNARSFRNTRIVPGRRRRGGAAALPGAGAPLPAGAGAGAVRRRAGRVRIAARPRHPPALPAVRGRPVGHRRGADRGGDMPEPTPPPDAGGAAGRRDGPLTPDAIDAALTDFRRWLEELAAGRPEPPPAADEPTVDLATLVGAFTALRHEVNLQTKAARAQSEHFARALEALQPPADAMDVRPLVKALTEVYDTLTRATKELDQLRQGVGDLGIEGVDDASES